MASNWHSLVLWSRTQTLPRPLAKDGNFFLACHQNFGPSDQNYRKYWSVPENSSPGMYTDQDYTTEKISARTADGQRLYC